MNKETLIAYWKKSGVVADERVIEAFKQVERSLFVAKDPYVDKPASIGGGQTISQPTTVAIMTQALQVEKGMKVLEVGAGSGYQAALLAALVEAKVYSIERDKNLVEKAKKNLEEAGITTVNLILGDGSLGLPSMAPFDRIIVTAAAPSVPPPLEEQLEELGIIVIPVGKFGQKMMVGTKRNGKMLYESLGDFVFVPLVGKHGFSDLSL